MDTTSIKRSACWLGLLLALGMGCLTTPAWARDVRLALLVANQKGWKSDPLLRYAVSGDLAPLAAILRSVGFEVKTLENQGPEALRRALQWVQQRTKQTPAINTFLFYYSGHADKQYLHMGPRTKRSIDYRTLAQFLQRLRVQRRFAIFDACFSGEVIRQFGTFKRYKRFIRKGIKSVQPIDISQNFQKKHDQRGLEVISSGLHYAWESLDHRASIFTYYLLQGLKGPADLDVDGKISMTELFNFVSQHMNRAVQQKPQFFGVIQRSKTYALAPAYHSRLRISAALQGTLRIRVANFYWRYKKQLQRPIRLALVHGRGFVEWQKGRSCWRQRVHLPKGKEASLDQHKWKKHPCRKIARQRKGSIDVVAQPYIPPERPRVWSLSLSGGTLFTRLAGQSWLAGASIALQHPWFAITAGLWGTNSQFGDQAYQQMLLQIDITGGYTLRFHRFQLFGGLFAGYTIFFQDLNRAQRAGSLFSYGASLVPGIRISDHWQLALPIRAGFLVGELGQRLSHIFQWSATLAMQYSL